MEQQGLLDLRKGLLVHSEKIPSITSNFIKKFLLQISSLGSKLPSSHKQMGKGRCHYGTTEKPDARESVHFTQH